MSGQIKRGRASTPFSSPSSTCGKNEAKVIPIYHCINHSKILCFQFSRYIQGTFKCHLEVLLSWLSKLMTLEFVEGRREMHKSIKAEHSNVKYASGDIRIRRAKKLRNTRMNVPPFGFLKNGNHSRWRI